MTPFFLLRRAPHPSRSLRRVGPNRKLTRNCSRREEFNAKRNSRVYGSKLRSAKPTSSNESMTFSNPVICSTCRK
jgi:hypothetical protein